MKRILIALLFVCVGACHDLRRADRAPPARAAVAAPAGAEFDNHEQVWQARDSGAIVPPHVVVAIEPTQDKEFSLWRVHLDASAPLDAVWAIRRTEAGGSIVLTPFRAIVAAPVAASAFDAKQWTPLDACALRGSWNAAGFRASADLAACTAIAPGIGAEAALLPLDVEREGEWLRLRLYADQARGADARENARWVRRFAGWAAINGGGPKAASDSGDWHMNRDVRLGSEGGRTPLVWRDGSASGYSLALERLTYRDGNIPVLKLSIVEDAGGRTLAYAWANPEATRIGINLGWVQVGLARDDVAPPTDKK